MQLPKLNGQVIHRDGNVITVDFGSGTITDSGLWARFKRAKEEGKLAEHITWEQFRHSFELARKAILPKSTDFTRDLVRAAKERNKRIEEN